MSGELNLVTRTSLTARKERSTTQYMINIFKILKFGCFLNLSSHPLIVCVRSKKIYGTWKLILQKSLLYYSTSSKLHRRPHRMNNTRRERERERGERERVMGGCDRLVHLHSSRGNNLQVFFFFLSFFFLSFFLSTLPSIYRTFFVSFFLVFFPSFRQSIYLSIYLSFFLSSY